MSAAASFAATCALRWAGFTHSPACGFLVSGVVDGEGGEGGGRSNTSSTSRLGCFFHDRPPRLRQVGTLSPHEEQRQDRKDYLLASLPENRRAGSRRLRKVILKNLDRIMKRDDVRDIG